MAPVVLGLGLAIPLAAWTSRRGPATALRRAGLLATPEERHPEPALAAVAALQPLYALPAEDPLTRLLNNPALLAAHLAMLPPPRRRGDPHDPALLIGRAKLEEAETLPEARTALTRPELLAVLTDRAALTRLLQLH